MISKNYERKEKKNCSENYETTSMHITYTWLIDMLPNATKNAPSKFGK
jgi:hypothetical protein